MRQVLGRAVAPVCAAVLLAGCAGAGGDAGGDRPAGPARSAGAAGGGSRAAGQGGADRPARSGTGPARPGAEPVRLRIPAAGVDTPVMRLGLDADGGVQVPPVTAHDRAGWYRHSPVPGRTGPSVLLGHVTVGAYGDGVFRRLDRLRPGDRIEVTAASGRTTEFAVTVVRTVRKAAFPADDVYGDVARPELRLITCGGPRGADGYRDNVIAFAVLADGTGAPGGTDATG